MMQRLSLVLAALVAASPAQSRQMSCDRACLDGIGTRYTQAYLAHAPGRAPFAKYFRFTENNVRMPIPDGTWDTVDREIGPSFIASDPITGEIGIFTSIMQNDVPGFLAIRLKVRGRKITEVEQFISTQRTLSLSKLGDVEGFVHDRDLPRPVKAEERMSRSQLVAMADGYFSTLERNDGKLVGIRFAPTASRLANGVTFPEIGKGFENGFYRFNDRVHDRNVFVVDEARGLVMAGMIIDHKGRLDRYKLIDGTEMRSPYREPHTLMGIELFKIKSGVITQMETIFIQIPYNMPSAWRRALPGR